MKPSQHSLLNELNQACGLRLASLDGLSGTARGIVKSLPQVMIARNVPPSGAWPGGKKRSIDAVCQILNVLVQYDDAASDSRNGVELPSDVRDMMKSMVAVCIGEPNLADSFMETVLGEIAAHLR
jgi:hypothetical protein